MSYAKLYLDFDMTCQWNPPELKWVSSFLSNFHAAASTNVTRWFACRIRSGKQASNQWCSPSDVLVQKCCAIITFWSVQHSQYPIRIVQSQTQHGLLQPCGRLISTPSCWISFYIIFWCSTTIITEITIWKILWRNILQAFVWKKSKFHPCWTNAAPPVLGTQRCVGFTSVCRVQNAVLQIWNLQDLVFNQWVFWRWWLLC